MAHYSLSSISIPSPFRREDLSSATPHASGILRTTMTVARIEAAATATIITPNISRVALAPTSESAASDSRVHCAGASAVCGSALPSVDERKGVGSMT